MTLTLVLDDQADSRALLRTVLEHAGHQVIEASSGDEALEMAVARSPDLIVSDILMPQMDGYEFVRRLRSSTKIRQPAVIFCTGTFRADEASEIGRQCGVAHVIAKPAPPEEILRVAEHALATPFAAPPPASPDAERVRLRALNHKLVEKMSELDSARNDIVRVSKDVERRARQQAAVAALGQKALAGGSSRELFEEAVEKVIDGVEADAAAILELLDGGESLIVSAATVMKGVVPGQTTTPASNGSQAGYTLMVGAPVVSENLPLETRFRSNPVLLQLGVVASASAPIMGPRGAFGVVIAHFHSAHSVSATDVDFLQAIANGLGSAMARIEAEARSRELAAIVENSTDSVISTDLDGRITSWNRAATDIFGWAEEEAIGEPISIIVPPAALSAQRLMIESVVSGQSVRNRELPVVRKDGRELTAALTLFPVTGPLGEVVGTGGITRDVTEAVALREQAAALGLRLRQAERLEAVGQLAGGVAHDFNNMLAVIINYAEFVIAEIGDDALRDDVQEIKLAAERAAGLTRQLLVFSRREVLKPELVDLNEIVDEARSLLTRTLGEHIELETNCEPSLWTVEADRGQFEQVLVNLAVNSRYAMREGGVLGITTKNVTLDNAGSLPLHPGRYVGIEVRDTGCGMNDEQLEHAFEPFFTTKPRGLGTGLGLSSAYGAIHHAGGHIELRSVVSEGTTVAIWLPASDEPPARRSEEFQIVDTYDAAGTTVLVVEDAPEVRRLVARILATRGYAVLTAPGPLEAISIAAEHDTAIDLLLTDVVMPKMLGPELAARLHERRPGLRVLFMSGYTDDEMMVEGVRNADIAFLEKPFHAGDLLAAVGAALTARAVKA
ncbi:MAG: response regulator [Gaiellaceae bacterium]